MRNGGRKRRAVAAALLAGSLLLAGCEAGAGPAPGTTTASPAGTPAEGGPGRTAATDTSAPASPASPPPASEVPQPAPAGSTPAAGGPPSPATASPGTRGPAPATGGPAAQPGTPAPAPAPVPAPAPKPAPAPAPAGGHADPGAIDVVVNKARPLRPADYAPADLVPVPGAADFLLRAEAAAAAGRMIAAAAQDGVRLTVLSAYRSYARQVTTYQGWVDAYGSRAEADKVSARPGYSEHQTGLALDVGQAGGRCSLESCFGDTAAGRWVAGHGHEFGFVIRYPAGKTAITGYSPEPWHLRYVGVATAGAVVRGGATGTATTLEEYWGLPAAPGYP